MAEVSYGLVPDLGGTGRLLRLVGYQRALEICATGRHVSAEEAVADRAGAGQRAARRTGRGGRRPGGRPGGVAGRRRPGDQGADAARAHDNTADEQLAAERAAQIPLLAALGQAAAPRRPVQRSSALQAPVRRPAARPATVPAITGEPTSG